MPNKKNLSKESFVIRAIKELRKSSGSGINPKSSGFRHAFRKYFDEEPDPTLRKLWNNRIIQVEHTQSGKVISLAEDQTEKAIKELEKTPDQELKHTTEESNNLSLDHHLPLLFDEKGVHETTEYALTYSPNRAWLKEFTEKGNRIEIKAIYLAQEYLEGAKNSAWVRKEKLWLITPSDVGSIIDHYRSEGYQVVLSPEISEIALKTLNLSV